MKDLLSELQAQLVAKKIPALNLLNPPIENASLLKDLLINFWDDTISVPEDLIELYSWHNGTAFNSETIKKGYVSKELFFNTPNYAIEIAAEDDFFNFKKDFLIPVFTSFNGEYIALDISANGKGALFYCGTSDFEVDNVTQIYDSLNSMFETILAFYKANLLMLDDEIIELDYDKYDEYLDIGLSNNPDSDYWKRKKEWSIQ